MNGGAAVKISSKLLMSVAAVALVGVAGASGAAAGGGAGSPQPSAPQLHKALSTPFDTSTESRFTPIAPCRIVDTLRHGGRIAAGHARSFVVAGTTAFAPQGGTVGGCGVPKSATAVAATVTAVRATGLGYLQIWPFGSAPTSSSFLGFTNVFSASSGGTIAVNTATAQHITVRALVNATFVAIDVTGYYVAPMAAEVSNTGALVRGSRVTGVSRLGTGQYEIDFDRNVSACEYAATPFLNSFTIAAEPRSSNVDGVFVYIETPAGVLSDQLFYLSVTC